MNIKNNTILIDQSLKDKKQVKRSARQFSHSLEYEVIANLVLQQYEKDREVRFDLLWNIAPADRIPALSREYGKKRMYQLITTLLKEFCLSVPLPKSKKLNDTRIKVCSCDLMISAEEEKLSIEDLIVFFERVKKGNYGPTKYLTHQLIKEKLKDYLEERNRAFAKLSQEKHSKLKALGPLERLCEEPKKIGELLKEASVIEMNKRMSG